MAAVMIGIDPHKASHTAVAIDEKEVPLGEVRVRASAAQAGRLVAWAASWPEWTWAVEGAGGLGYLLAQQLVAAGERVLDVQPKLGARVRLLATGATSKNDPNDARSVAIAALRSAAPRKVAAENHAAVLKVWSKRHRDLGRTRTQVACRLHAVLCELIPGGIAKEIVAAQAAHVREGIEPSGAAGVARCELAAEFLDDLRRIDAQMRDTKKRLTAAVRASGTTVTEVFGAGPVIAATVIGYIADASRFPSRDNFAAYNGTAPIEVSSGNRKIYRLSRRGNRRLNHAVHMAAVTQIRHRHSDGRAYYDRKLAEGKTPKKRSGPSSGASATPSTPACKPTPGGPPQLPGPGAREATGEPLCLQGGRLTPRTPALRTSHSRASGQPTRHRSAHPGHAAQAAREQNPASPLTTTTTKRIRSGRWHGCRGFRLGRAGMFVLRCACGQWIGPAVSRLAVRIAGEGQFLRSQLRLNLEVRRARR